MSPLFPFHIDPTPANALHLLRSRWRCQLVGPALAAHTNRLILAEIAEVPVELSSREDLETQVRQDLVDSLEQHKCGSDSGPASESAKKHQRTEARLNQNMQDKTSQVLFMLQNRVASSRVSDTITSAHELIQTLTAETSKTSTCELLDQLYCRHSLMRHLLLLDGAVDRCTSDMLMSLREEGRFAGVALATDESPPNQPRFRGLRFQITIMYWGAYKDLATWDSCEDPPIIVSTCLADIMHCPGKKGKQVKAIIEKQLARLGLNCFDVVAGTGDGGGENEGQQGVHAHFEDLNPGYIRRRCLPHMSWRTCDVAIRASQLDYRALAAYLVEGITWTRLRELATRAPADGGLGLFRDGSQQCKDLFGRSPCAIVETRPQTDLNFLKLLAGKEHLLHRLASRDLEQRSLSTETRGAIQNLANTKARIRRRVQQEILERCLFLLYWSGQHPTVTSETTWDQLMQKAAGLILDLEITSRVLEMFQVTEADLGRLEARPKTWVELAVLQVVGDEHLVGEHLPEA